MIQGFLNFVNWMWGVPMLIVLIGGGIAITVACDFVQVKHLGASLKHAWNTAFHSKKGEGEIDGFQAVTAALANTIGTGNIVGVGAAIAVGGPGAVFWMWVIGFIAMALKYSEATLAVATRYKGEDGRWKGGAPVYLAKVWKPLGVIWGITMIYAMAIGCGAHTGSVGAGAAQFGVPTTVTTVIILIVVLMVAIGGVTFLVKITDKMVPFMAILYLAAGLIVIILNIGNLPSAIGSIFAGAFTGTAATGGFAGSTLSAVIRNGCARGVYSSDAGNGSASLMHAQADTNEPVEQGMMGVFEVFTDTIVICTFTALVILTTQTWMTGAEGSVLAVNGFEASLGVVGKVIGAVSLILFPLSSVLSITAGIGVIVHDIFDSKIVHYIAVALVAAVVFAGGTIGIDAFLVWVDSGNLVAILAHIVGVLVMIPLLRKLTKEYFDKQKESKTA